MGLKRKPELVHEYDKKYSSVFQLAMYSVYVKQKNLSRHLLSHSQYFYLADLYLEVSCCLLLDLISQRMNLESVEARNKLKKIY